MTSKSVNPNLSPSNNASLDKQTQLQPALRQLAHQYAGEYQQQVAHQRVYPSPESLANLAHFREALPQHSCDPESVLELLHQHGSPATVAQTGGRYFGFVNGGALPVASAAGVLAGAWDQNSALAVMSPICAELEGVCQQWLQQLLGLPDNLVAGFVSGSSLAIFCGLAAGRFRLYQRLGWDINKRGLYNAPPLRIVAPELAHGTVVKAVALLGFGIDNIEWVPCDKQGRCIADKVPPLDERCILLLQAGNVSSGCFDPIEVLCQRARQAGAWVHIDGAFGLWAAACPELAHLTCGMELANSFSVDGHKTLNTPYDNGIVLCDDAEALQQALQASGSYIQYDGTRDGMLYTPEMSRRGRVIELWATLKYLGREGVAELVLGLHHKALLFRDLLSQAGFRILNDVVFNQVLVACDTPQQTQAVMRHIQQSGECWLGGATWQGEAVMRVSVCSWATTEDDVQRSVAAFMTAREQLQ